MTITNKDLKSLITNECANYSSNNNYCCLEQYRDNKCIYFLPDEEKPRCGYFEKCVLPLDIGLKEVYYRELQEEKLTKNERQEIMKEVKERNKIKLLCEKCGREFTANSNRQKYCKECKKVIQREQIKKRVNKFRDRYM